MVIAADSPKRLARPKIADGLTTIGATMPPTNVTPVPISACGTLRHTVWCLQDHALVRRGGPEVCLRRLGTWKVGAIGSPRAGSVTLHAQKLRID